MVCYGILCLFLDVVFKNYDLRCADEDLHAFAVHASTNGEDTTHPMYMTSSVLDNVHDTRKVFIPKPNIG